MICRLFTIFISCFHVKESALFHVFTALQLYLTGVLSGGHIGHGELLQQRLRCGQIWEALGILEAMDWSSIGDECFRGLSFIANHLLRLELNTEREGESKKS